MHVSIPTTGITTVEIFVNFIISTPNAKIFVIGIKNTLLNNNLNDYQYMHIPLTLITNKIIRRYNIFF